ncbi:MAG: hypothetical protein IT319_11700 [Anaerolineae bacterium]|nr:hypothetical protein [Anaerolineae bacterium]
MTPDALEVVSRQYGKLPREKRVVFVHPNYRAQHVMLRDLPDQAVYVRLEGQGLSEEQLQTQLDTALRRQNTRSSAVVGGAHDVILDESDRAVPAALMRFVRQLLERLSGGRVILLSRIVPEGWLDDNDLCRQTTFLPAESRMMLWDYGQNLSGALLEVRAFGEGRVQLNGRNVENWDGALPRALFFYLVDRGMVTRAEIFETFWPALTTREATNVFHVTKRKISEVLGMELTVYGSSFYHISPQIQLSYDVSLFNQLVQDSDSGDRNGDLLRQALGLYRGDYLMSLKSDWVVNRRESLQQAACDTLVTLGRICEREGSPREALGYYVRASHLKPEREDSAYAAMRLYGELDMPQDGVKTYQRLARTLQARLNVTPSPQLQQLAEQLSG